MSVKFNKHTLELIVRAEEYPGILENAFEIATITISNVVFVGEIIGVSAKKVKDKKTDEIEVWANVKLNVSTLATTDEACINHPGRNNEIEGHVDICVTNQDISDNGIKSSEEATFNFD